MNLYTAARVLWPPGTCIQNTVKLAAADELAMRGGTLDLGQVANPLAEVLGAPVNQLLHPDSLSSVLRRDPAFRLHYSENMHGDCCLVHVQLRVGFVLETAVRLTADLGPPEPPVHPHLSPVHVGPYNEPLAAIQPFHRARLPGPRVNQQHASQHQPALPPHLVQRMRPALQPASFQQRKKPVPPLGLAVQQPQPLQERHVLPVTYRLQQEQQPDGCYVARLSHINHAAAALQDSTDHGAGVGCSAGSGGRRKAGRRGTDLGPGADDDAVDPDLNTLLDLLPDDPELHYQLHPYIIPHSSPALVDVAADLGRPITLRLSDRTSVQLTVSLDIPAALTRLAAAYGAGQQPAAACSRTTRSGRRPAQQAAGNSSGCDNERRAPFFSDTNRLGVPGSLHRISAMRDRAGDVYGLTYRVGRHVPGVADLLADVLSDMRSAVRGERSSDNQCSLVPSLARQTSKSLLLLGRPGVGKTTLLRDVARLMSSAPEAGGLGMSVVIVDTSNEIAGDCVEPHPCIGSARRMMVPSRDLQASVMIEAVMNHTPEVIIVDEIATRQEAAACRTIAQRGVLLVSTAHGNSLGDLLSNPDLQGLVGGVKPVTLGDQLARGVNGGVKTRLERAGAVTFGALLELTETHRWRLHPDVSQSVDYLLAKSTCTASSSSGNSTDLHLPQLAAPGVDTQLRSKDSQGTLLVKFENGRVPRTAAWAQGAGALEPWVEDAGALDPWVEAAAGPEPWFDDAAALEPWYEDAGAPEPWVEAAGAPEPWAEGAGAPEPWVEGLGAATAWAPGHLQQPGHVQEAVAAGRKRGRGHTSPGMQQQERAYQSPQPKRRKQATHPQPKRPKRATNPQHNQGRRAGSSAQARPKRSSQARRPGQVQAAGRRTPRRARKPKV